MRRKDREMDRNFALAVADKCEYANIAMADKKRHALLRARNHSAQRRPHILSLGSRRPKKPNTQRKPRGVSYMRPVTLTA